MNQPVRIKMKADTLHEDMQRFAMAPLKESVFLNSVPKSGTHLLRNIVRMFVPAEQQYHRDFIQLPNLHLHLAAFAGQPPAVSWGHLLFADPSAVALKGVRQVVLVRDPYDWVLARARFYLSEEFQGSLNNIKGGAAAIDDVLNLMIFGSFQKAPSLLDIYTFNAVAWMNGATFMVRYEDIVRHLKALDGIAANAFFAELLGACGIDLPADWRERVRIGSDRKHSATAREHLSNDVAVPDDLPERQKRLVDFAAPGLRAMLGYG
ncbi:MAG: hypothetical protein NW203_09455 [Hyphomonadaceae bacterium]|nr:hypothetical protein [Hyphomonadaceae bacterium]